MTAPAENASAHKAVLEERAVEVLLNDPSGRYVDGTFGRGGHTRQLLARLDDDALVLGVDRDPEAVSEGQGLEARDPRFRIYRASFEVLGEVLDDIDWPQVHGVLLDLGVSSPQLDDAARGFSFQHDGPLDMRMDPDSGESAAEWLNRAEEGDIVRVLKYYGEERFAKRIARRIVTAREETPLVSTHQLAELIDEAVPVKEKHKHPATRSFQAIRIYLNRELEALDAVLGLAADRLAPGGRLVVISFHSLEDRRVKRFMRDRSRGPQMPKGVPVTADQQKSGYRVLGKAIKADDEEIRANPRARSAVMRVLECQE